MLMTEIDRNRLDLRNDRMERKANDHAHTLALHHMEQLRKSSERQLATLRLVA